MKFADKLVGKGLDTWIIIQLVMYNLAWMVVLVVPMSVLVATLMAFGGMSQNNEITIMKSSGMSLYRMMTGPFIASIVVGYFLIIFNNDVLPDANHSAKILMEDISQKKPTLSLEPGVFSQEVSNYAILCREVDPHSNKIFGVTIYDYTELNNIRVVTAKSGNIYFSNNYTKLIMDLANGEIHEQEAEGTRLYRKLVFTNHRIAMNADQFSFQQSGPGSSRGDRELSAADMMTIVDSFKVLRDEVFAKFDIDFDKHFLGDSLAKPLQLAEGKLADIENTYSALVERTRSTKNFLLSYLTRADFFNKEIDKYMVEVHKKYSIPAACLVFILLGAPLGVMIRKGGFGMSASISLFFFLVYWASLIGGEKLADRGFITPFWGMWSANIIMTILGIILTVRVAKENVHLEFVWLKKLIPKNWRLPQETQDENS